jgi:hypothetical protein
VQTQDLPEPVPLRRIVGASVVLLATAMGSGEFIIWPYVTTQIGIAFLWMAMIGIFMQWLLNMEIERYTLATGETAVTGFTRFWKPWGIIFVLGAILLMPSPAGRRARPRCSPTSSASAAPP